MQMLRGARGVHHGWWIHLNYARDQDVAITSPAAPSALLASLSLSSHCLPRWPSFADYHSASSCRSPERPSSMRSPCIATPPSQAEFNARPETFRHLDPACTGHQVRPTGLYQGTFAVAGCPLWRCTALTPCRTASISLTLCPSSILGLFPWSLMPFIVPHHHDDQALREANMPRFILLRPDSIAAFAPSSIKYK